MPELRLLGGPTPTRMTVDGAHVYADGRAYYPSASAVIAELRPYRGPPNDGSAARVGTAAHEGMARYVLSGIGAGYAGPMGSTQEAEQAGSHMARLARAMGDIGEVYAVERPMVSAALGVGGTADMVCRHGGELAVLDWKTKSREPDADTVGMHHLQCAMYAWMWKELTGELPARLAVVASWPDEHRTYLAHTDPVMREVFSERVIDAIGRVRAGLRP